MGFQKGSSKEQRTVNRLVLFTEVVSSGARLVAPVAEMAVKIPQFFGSMGMFFRTEEQTLADRSVHLFQAGVAGLQVAFISKAFFEELSCGPSENSNTCQIILWLSFIYKGIAVVSAGLSETIRKPYLGPMNTSAGTSDVTPTITIGAPTPRVSANNLSSLRHDIGTEPIDIELGPTEPIAVRGGPA